MASGDNYNSEVDDPFNNVFYRIIPSEKATHIHFYAQPLFNMIISVLEKEFNTPGDDVNRFLLKTHIDGKKCHIQVDKSDRTIVATGPGHVTWKENSFRKMSVNMFKKFVDKTNSNMNNSADVNLSEATRQVSSAIASSSPILRNISALMDMIHTLQGEMTELRKEVNMLVKQATTSFTQSANDTTLSRAEDNHNCEHGENQDITENEMPRVINFPDVQDLNQRGNFTADAIRLTSTPGPTPTRLHETFVVPNSPSSSTPQVTRSQTKATPTMPTSSTKKILLIGDSIITGVNKQGLKDNVYRHGISGATVKTLLNEIEVYDLKQFSHAVIYIGGNNASNGTDIKHFEEMYRKLLTHIKLKSDCKMVLVNSCPRGDTDTSAVNNVIRRLSEHYEAEFVDAYKAFYDKNSKLITKYYSTDSVHLSDSGIRRLLGTINGKLEIVQDFSYCAFSKPASKRYQRTRAAPIRRTNLIYPNQDGVQLQCAKCGENNHETRNCRHKEQLQCHQCGYYGHKSRRCGPQ